MGKRWVVKSLESVFRNFINFICVSIKSFIKSVKRIGQWIPIDEVQQFDIRRQVGRKKGIAANAFDLVGVELEVLEAGETFLPSNGGPNSFFHRLL